MTTRATNICSAALALTLGGLALFGGPAQAQLNDKLPKDLEGLAVEQKMDAQLPLDLTFTNETGYPVKLGDYFGQGKPVILTLNYYSCPMLCTLMLNGLVDSLKQVELTPGTDFDIVTVSINPSETTELTMQKKQHYCDYYGKPGISSGWHWHTGSAQNIKTLADTVGFHYRWLPETQEYAHPAVMMICTPEGKVSRYLAGVQYDPKTVRLSLVEASKGRIGNMIDDFMLFCYMYDASQGKYVATAVSIMRTGGVLTILLIVLVLLSLWGRELHRRREWQAKMDNEETRVEALVGPPATGATRT